MAEVALRPELAELPDRIARLPTERGYPVPWFVAWVDGHADFRVVAPGKVDEALRFRRCWICGQPLGRYIAYVAGPMCAVNRTSSEPPSHRDCAIFSALSCPFLTKPQMRRREGGLPDGTAEPAGIMLRRNPGVALVWISAGKIITKRAPNGRLFHLGTPTEVLWFAEGREATRAEVEESLRTGEPALRELAEAQGPHAVRMLEGALEAVGGLLP